MSSISVVMPVFNEAPTIEQQVRSVLAILRPQDELIVVNGESTDDTAQCLHTLVQKSAPSPHRLSVLCTRKGRAHQMNMGARQASNEVLLFLHADTTVSRQAWDQLTQLAQNTQAGVRYWGRFDVRLHGRSKGLPMVAGFMNWRSRLTHICTGDQGIFITRNLFQCIGGYFEQPLMEDIELCTTLKAQPDAHYLPLQGPVVSSGRRWDSHGLWPTIWLMWRFRFAYWRGASAYDLARKYADVRHRS
ncbi:MAG: glycosyltransferase family 2 protein [Limnobacter sp.]|nr:glycosyltransferase family 2 protein [Limnobacter sp.]